MSKYIAKATVWFSIDSNYPADGGGEAQHEIRGIVKSLEKMKGVEIAHATDIEIKGGQLLTFESESDTGLVFNTPQGKRKVLDSGMR